MPRKQVLWIAAFLCPLVLTADNADDLRLRWRQMLIGGGSLDTGIVEVRSRISSIQSAGDRDWTSMVNSGTPSALWTDLPSTTVSAQISSAYGRLRDMALAWATPGQSLYQNANLLAGIVWGMDWMDAHRYNPKSTEYDNWWDWEIGTPAYVVDIAVLLYDQLTPDQLTRYMAAVNRFDSDPRVMEVSTYRVTSTGANLADKCKIALLRGVLVKDTAQISLAVTSLSPVFAYVTSGDGFYADGSFIQHTRHPYTGSYGLVLLGDVANLLWLLAGSPWDVTGPGRDNVPDWIAKGFAPLIYEGAMMDMARGRAISRSSSSDHVIGHNVIGALLRFAQIFPPDAAAQLQSAVKRWLLDDASLNYANSLPLDLIAVARRMLDDDSVAPADLPAWSHVYASMDRAVHLRPAWAAAIAMHSTRIYNYESINHENLRGWHTGDGMTYLYDSDLAQFDGPFWPTIDPQRLPGTTVIAGSTARQSQLGGSNVVGGVSLDGYSAVMMQLSPDGRQLSAKKSWFLLDDELVALGADIHSTSSAGTVETIVENRRLTSDAVFTPDPNRAWASLTTAQTTIGYVFPDGAPWQSLNETRTGAWQDINSLSGSPAQVSGRFQTLWFDHGVKPSGATYSYILLPGKSAEDTAAYASSPAVQILQNDASAQAIAHSGLGIEAVNFWMPADSVAGISSDSTASVLVHEANGLLNIAVSDPTQANKGTIHLEIATPAAGVVAVDSGMTVDQLAPTIRLSVNVNQSAGRPLQASLSVAQ